MTPIRRIGTLLAIALLATGALVPSGAAHAQSATSLGTSITGAAASLNPVGAAASAVSSIAGSVTGTNNSTLGGIGTALNGVFGWVFAKIASLFAWLLGAAAVILDIAVFYTIVHMGDFFHGVTAISVVWGVLRNIGNIALIFGFVLTGIAIIIDSDIYGSRTKMIPMLLVAAVFINFSLFFGEVIVDAGNLIATEVFVQINGGQLPTVGSMFGGANSSFFTAVSQEGISNRIMSVLGLQTIYNPGQNASIDSSKLSDSALTSFMAMILFLIAAFVFFSLAFIVVARFVALVFILILAPLGFAGLIVPGLKKIAGQWWDALIKQTVTAPVLILLLYIALAVITDAKFLLYGGGIGGANGANTSANAWQSFLNSSGNGSIDLQTFGGILLVFVIAMGLLLAVVITSKNLAAFGGAWATRMGGRLSGLTIAAATPGIIGRNTIGLASLTGSRAWRKSSLSRIPVLGRSVAGVLDKGAKSSFDWRPTDGKVKIQGFDLNIGKRQKGGLAEEEKKEIKAKETYAKSLELNKQEDTDAKDARKAFNERKENLTNEQRKAQKKSLEEEEKKVIALEQKAKIEYAEGLKDSVLSWRYTNSKAADNILKEARKKPSAKGLEGAVKAAIEENPEDYGVPAAGGGAAAGGEGGAVVAAGGGEGGGAGGGVATT